VLLLFEDPLADIVNRLMAESSFKLTDPRLLAPESIVVEVVAHTPDKFGPPPPADLSRVSIGPTEWRALHETFTVLKELDVSVPSVPTRRDLRARFAAACRFLTSVGGDFEQSEGEPLVFRHQPLKDPFTSPEPQDWFFALGCF
jgi:hypothetical protein